MKKKIWTGILAAALVFSIGSTTALAAAPKYLGCRGRYEKLKTSFDHIHAEPDLKAGTREFLLRKMSEYSERPAVHRNLLAAATQEGH